MLSICPSVPLVPYNLVRLQLPVVAQQIEHVLALAGTDSGRDLAATLTASGDGVAIANALVAGDGPRLELSRVLVVSGAGLGLAKALARSGSRQEELAEALAGSDSGLGLARLLAGSDSGLGLARVLIESDAGRDLIQDLVATSAGRNLIRDLGMSGAGLDLIRDLANGGAGLRLIRVLVGSGLDLDLARALAESGADLARNLAQSSAGRQLGHVLGETGAELARNLAQSGAGLEIARFLDGSGDSRASASALAASDAVLRLAEALAGTDAGLELGRAVAWSVLARSQSSAVAAAVVVWLVALGGLWAIVYGSIGVASAILVFATAALMQEDGQADPEPLTDGPELDIEPRSVGDVVEKHELVDSLRRDAAAEMTGRLERLLGHVEVLIQQGVFADDILLEQQVTAGRTYLRTLLLGDRDGNLNIPIILANSQQLIADIAPYMPRDQPGAELGMALAHGPEEEPDFNTAVEDADTVATALEHSPPDDLPANVSIYEWLAAHLSWRRAMRGGLAGAGLGTTADVSGILQALHLSGPWAILIGAALGLLAAAWKPATSDGK